MKQKKQRRKLKQWIAAALGLTLLGTGLWVGMNEEKLQAKPQTTDFQNISLEPKVAGWPFLSQGVLGDGSTPESVWQNIETATIPAENSLVFKGPNAGEADMSKIRSSGLDFESYHMKGRVATYKLSPDPQWLEMDDVGYYQRKRIGLRVIVQLIDPPSSLPTTPNSHGIIPSMTEAWIGYASSHCASVSIPSWLSNGANITYEVYDVDDSTRKAIPFSGYFPIVPSWEGTMISILNWSQIVDSENHIYSASATSTSRTQVQYQLQENVLTLTRNMQIDGDRNSVFTFTNQSSLGFRLVPIEDGAEWRINDALLYNADIAMRIAIPNPEPLEVPDVKEIKTNTEMNYQFNQQIPPEPASKRDQRVEWTLKTDDNKTVVPDVDAAGTLKSWTVADLDGNDMTSKFEVTSFNESTNEVTIAPKEAQYTEDSFYNHYYTFKSKLKIDYTKPIDEKLLKERDGGKYLDKTGTVTLAVNGVAREEQEFKTSINFASTVNYAYLVQGTSTEVPGFTPTTAQKTGEGIITHEAALTPPSPIGTANKYQYASVEPANKIIKYSTQDMKFYYAQDEPWLPYYKPGLGIGGGGWLDTMESYIPRSNAFVALQSPTTEIIPLTNGFDKNASGNAWYPSIRINYTAGKTEKIKFTNIGFYEGKKVSVVVSLTPQETPLPIVRGSNLIGYGTSFLNLQYSGTGRLNVQYDFYDEKDEEIRIASYWNISNIFSKSFVISSDIENIYSLSRQNNPPVLLKYSLLDDGKQIHIQGPDNQPNADAINTTITFNKQQEMKYQVIPNYNIPSGQVPGGWISYGRSLVKVEIPDPQVTAQTYTEIIGTDKGITNDQTIDSLDYGFIQQMPWESVSPINNRTQIPTWILGVPTGNATLVPSPQWKVQAQDDPKLGNGDVYDWFTADDNTLTPTGGLLTGKLAEDEFYNHYYKFNRSLNIDYNNRIARTSLKAKDGRYYFDYSGKVDLVVEDTNPTPEQEAGMNKNREEVNYDTAINFHAPLEYKYVNSVTGEEIPAGSLPTSAKPAGDGIVTWDAPLTPQQLTEESYTQETGQGDAPAIAGYAFDRSELNGSETDTQIKVTKLLRSEAPAGRQTGNLLPSLMADYGLNLNESKNEGEKPISFNQLVQPDSLTQILQSRAVDATDPANYDQNNVVTLYYTPVSYDVEIEVTKPNGDTLEATANSYFEVSSDNGETWVTVSGYDFAAGNTYKIRQKEAVDQYYTKAGESPAFTVEVDAEGNFTLTATDDDSYSFIRTELVDKKLKIKVINQPSGGIVLSQVEPLDYGTVQMPRKDITINRVNPDWKIDFEDNRPPEDGNKLHLYVTLTKEFTDNNGAGTKELAGILAFINEPGAITNNDLLVKDTQMPIKMIDAPKYGADSVTWAKDAGFLLQLDRETEAKLNVGKNQNYRAELTFTLAEDPLP